MVSSWRGRNKLIYALTTCQPHIFYLWTSSASIETMRQLEIWKRVTKFNRMGHLRVKVSRFLFSYSIITYHEPLGFLPVQGIS
jgi:hypothetical protein